jgi:tetratricopeptide (TPR) repeat protein
LAAVAKIAPRGPDRPRFYRVLGGCFQSNSATSARIDELILREVPDDPIANQREGRRRLHAGDATAALAHAERALRQSEEREHALLLKAHALSRLGRKQEAIQALREGQRWAGRPGLLLVLEADLHAQVGNRHGMETAIGRLKGLASADSELLVQAFALEAQLEERLGSPVSALRAFEESYRVTGDPGALRGIARVAETLGNRGRAAWAYGQLCDMVGEATSCQRRRELLATSR